MIDFRGAIRYNLKFEKVYTTNTIKAAGIRRMWIPIMRVRSLIRAVEGRVEEECIE